jgi:hypothetical protein
LALDKHKLYAAVTGDVIKSSAFNDSTRGLLHDAILTVSDELQAYFPELLEGEVSIFRGDSVQFLLSDPLSALRVALFFRTALKASLAEHKADMRLAIGIGQVSFLPVSGQGGADGEAYRLSGASLDAFSTKETLAINITSGWGIAEQRQALQTIAILLGFQADCWTYKQALAVKWALLDRTQEEIRQLWPESVTRQAIAKNLDGAGLFAVEQALNFFEQQTFELKATP